MLTQTITKLGILPTLYRVGGGLKMPKSERFKEFQQLVAVILR
jgi:hypothetical protein